MTRHVSTALTAAVLGLLMSLLASPASAMNVFVNVMMDNTTIVIDVELSDTIEAVKTKIEDKTGYTPDQQVLEIDGIFLDDGTILSDYGIQAGATIDMLPITGLPPRSSSEVSDSLPQTGFSPEIPVITALITLSSGLMLLLIAASRRRTKQR